ncbi:MAG: glycosyltransferase family 2 protein [Candidatus Rokubacteria bacterium]|nr:glycosyltransferase family 2 protein [Candidatus Rokubacteria bacterium]
MDVSVLIATYNRAISLGRTLTALQGQRTAPGLTWELVVVDNNSSDDTRAVVSAAGAGFPVPMRYIFESRQGVSHARNTGIDNAKGGIIAITDDDCRPEPAWLQNVVDCMQRWDADILGGRILPEWSSPPPPWLATDRHLWTTLAMLDDSVVRRVELGPWQREHGFRVWTANMAIRRSVCEMGRCFDPAIGPRGKKKYSHEDILFVRKMVEAGKIVVYDPTPTVHHWVGPERMRKGFFRRHSFYYGEGSAFRTGPPKGRHIVGIPPFLVGAIARNVVAWIGAALRRDPESFCQEREIHESIGYLSGYVKCALRAGQYARLRRAPVPDPDFKERAGL